MEHHAYLMAELLCVMIGSSVAVYAHPRFGAVFMVVGGFSLAFMSGLIPVFEMLACLWKLSNH